MENTRPRLLVAFDTIEEAYDLLEEHFEVVRPPKGRDFSKAELLAMLGDFDALASVFDIPIDREIIEAGGSKLKIISNYAVGYNNIDLETAQRLGIAVTNTPQSVVLPTAELTLALLLAVSRRVAELDGAMRQQQDKLHLSRIDNLGVDLAGKKMGIIGFGNIGKAVAQRAKAFGMELWYNKRNRLSIEEEKALDLHFASVDEIFSDCEVVSLHTPLTKETKHLACRKQLERMKPNAILLNLARGPVVDEEALADLLEKGAIRGAGLDVFENNDKPNPRLYSLSNVVMTPHVGTQTYDARMRMAEELCNNLTGFFFHQGKEVSFVVRP